jgi:hypothetical protein
MQHALDGYQDDFSKIALLPYTNGTPISHYDISSLQATTGLIMMYIAAHLLAAGKVAISESQMKILLNQAEYVLWNLSRQNPHNPLFTLLTLQISCPPHSLPLHVIQRSSMQP